MVQNPPALVHCLVTNTRSGDPFDDNFVLTTNEMKKDNSIANEPPDAEFGKLTCSDDDYKSGDGDDCITDTPKDKVKHYSMTSYVPFMKNKRDSGVVTIPYSIGYFDIKQDICDLRVGINSIPLVIYKILGLGELKPIFSRLLIVD